MVMFCHVTCVSILYCVVLEIDNFELQCGAPIALLGVVVEHCCLGFMCEERIISKFGLESGLRV